jgi:hypothetical protein
MPRIKTPPRPRRLRAALSGFALAAGGAVLATGLPSILVARAAEPPTNGPFGSGSAPPPTNRTRNAPAALLRTHSGDGRRCRILTDAPAAPVEDGRSDAARDAAQGSDTSVHVGRRLNSRAAIPLHRRRPPERTCKAAANCGPSPTANAYRSAAYSLRRLAAASPSGHTTEQTATALRITATAHCRCCTACTTPITTSATTTTANRCSGCRRPTVASPIPIISRDAYRYGAASHAVTNANLVARVA